MDDYLKQQNDILPILLKAIRLRECAEKNKEVSAIFPKGNFCQEPDLSANGTGTNTRSQPRKKVSYMTDEISVRLALLPLQ